MKTRLCALVVVMLLLLVPGASQAQPGGAGSFHFKDELNNPFSNPMPHYVFDDWLIYSPSTFSNPTWPTMYWRADSNGKPYLEAAIDSWHAYDPRPGLWWEYSPGLWDLGAWSSNTNCGGGAAVACVTISQVVHDNTRQVTRWRKADIWYEFPSNWTAEQRRGAFRHELGHVHGLEDRYAVGGGCYSAEQTIMDRAGCDGYNLHTQDINNYNYYYATGEYAYNGSGYIPGNQIWYAWIDYAWNEWSMDVTFYYWTGSYWVSFYTQGVSTGVGTRYEVQARSLVGWVKPSNWGVHHKWITACAKPYLGRTWQNQTLYGQNRCTNVNQYWNE